MRIKDRGNNKETGGLTHVNNANQSNNSAVKTTNLLLLAEVQSFILHLTIFLFVQKNFLSMVFKIK